MTRQLLLKTYKYVYTDISTCMEHISTFLLISWHFPNFSASFVKRMNTCYVYTYIWGAHLNFRHCLLQFLQTLILVNNKISKISSGAFTPLVKLERLYLSKNQLKELPDKMPKTLQELRAHENEISKVRKTVFNGLNQMIVIGTDLIVAQGPGPGGKGEAPERISSNS